MISLIISHRGNDKHSFKENTKSAIISCLKSDYIDGVEFDIRITKDKRFVLNHGFLNNGKIIKYSKYKNLDLDELNNVLKQLKTKKIIMIEIKDNEKELIPLLYKIIKKYKNLNIYIQTFHYELAKKFKLKYPNIKVGIILFKIKNIDDYSIFDFISLNYLGYKNIKKELFLWTINSKEKQKKFISNNVITDKPWIIK